MDDSITPMMRQYRRIKGEMPPGVILFFRLGDFYEMFFEVAREAAPILDIALTKRNNVPMCGVPYHSVDSYLAKLLRAGRKVAICDQVEDASVSKDIVRREVTRVVTPGTVLESNILESKRNNFLAGVCNRSGAFGIAALDLSTGLFYGVSAEDTDRLRDCLRRIAPSECIVSSDAAGAGAGAGDGVTLTICEDWTFEYDFAYDNLIRHFGVHSLEGFGCEGNSAVVGAAGAVLYYVREQLRRQVGHVRTFRVKNDGDFLFLDETTCGNLDLLPSRGRSGSSLLEILDSTRTAMGARMLREWILRPLADIGAIRARHDAVESFVADRSLQREISGQLARVRDMERLIARINSGHGNARDLTAVCMSVEALPDIKALISRSRAPLLQRLCDDIIPLPDLVAGIRNTIVEEPPVSVKEGGLIRAGYSKDLDELRGAATEGRNWLAAYQAGEQNRTGIKNLKVRHNKVFGYFIEVSKGQLSNVPETYVRKQTLVNAERFITPELKEYENRIFGAQEKSMALEYEIFLEVRDAVVRETSRIQAAAEIVAQLDVISSLAERAAALRYVKPVMTTDDAIAVKDGRHPVVEQVPGSERFVPNDTLLDCSANQLIIITGPNMAGKSTYIRQVALLSIMAQMGSFVPAAEARMCLVDRVFTRVGASDDLARGRSTFMVEMQETANILNNATPKSLIVLDEIGRGTSTFDGISIAWAVAEFLHDHKRVKAKTLFATHYHELTDLALTMDGVKNHNVLVRESNDRIAFLRKIVPGAADKSYGIQVARLAGMPDEVIARSKEILANLEEGELGDSGQPKIAKSRSGRRKSDKSQLTLFGSAEGEDRR